MPQQPASKKKNARASLAFVAAASLSLAALSPFGAAPVIGFPMLTPAPISSPSATASPAASALRIGSSVMFVLDDTISSSASKRGDVVRVHLKDPLVVGGKTIASAGSPATVLVTNAQAAQTGDVYGFVDIYFRPLRLADGRELPLRAPTSHLTVNVTAGHESTVATEDTIGDIFIPYHVLYHAFRKGRNFELGAGSELRARTEASVDVLPNGAVAITTPLPVIIEAGEPHGSFKPMPLVTPHDTMRPSRPKPAPSPTVSPSPSAT